MREEVKGEGRRVRRREAIDEGEKSTESCMNVQTSNAPYIVSLHVYVLYMYLRAFEKETRQARASILANCYYFTRTK